MRFIHTGLYTGLSFEYLCLAITTYIFVNDNLSKKRWLTLIKPLEL